MDEDDDRLETLATSLVRRQIGGRSFPSGERHYFVVTSQVRVRLRERVPSVVFNVEYTQHRLGGSM